MLLIDLLMWFSILVVLELSCRPNMNIFTVLCSRLTRSILEELFRPLISKLVFDALLLGEAADREFIAINRGLLDGDIVPFCPSAKSSDSGIRIGVVA